MLKIGIVSTSVREESIGIGVAKWALKYANEHFGDEASFELINLQDYRLPSLGVEMTEKEGKDVARWSEAHKPLDGFIFVLGEYNHSIPGAFKNASDFLKPELADKAAGYIGYGGLGGARSIEQHRLVAAEQGLATVQKTLNFSLFTDFENFRTFKYNAAIHDANAKLLFTQVIAWAKALKTIR